MRRNHYLLYSLTVVSLLALLFSSAGCGGPERPDSDARYDVIIVGGGMGGLLGKHSVPDVLHAGCAFMTKSNSCELPCTWLVVVR